MLSPLDSIADTLRRAFHARAGYRQEPQPWDRIREAERHGYREDVKAVLHGLGSLDDATFALAWRHLRADPTRYGTRPDQATRLLLEALFEEITG